MARHHTIRTRLLHQGAAAHGRRDRALRSELPERKAPVPTRGAGGGQGSLYNQELGSQGDYSKSPVFAVDTRLGVH
jgi:hypothetical protein